MRNFNWFQVLMTLALLPLFAIASDGKQGTGPRIEHMKRWAAASSCAWSGSAEDCDSTGGPYGPSFSPMRAIDGRQDTIWSSRYSSSSSTYQYFAFWFSNGRGDDYPATNYIRIRPRIVNGQSGHVPETVAVYYASPGGWVPVPDPNNSAGLVVNLPAQIGSVGHVIDFAEAVNASGILLTTSSLRDSAWDTGSYYFQLAEVDAGYTNCNSWTGDADMLSWCNSNPAYFNNVVPDTIYLANDKVKFGVNASYGGVIFELFGKSMGTVQQGDFRRAIWNHNAIHPNGGSAMQVDLYGTLASYDSNLCPDLANPSPFGWLNNAIMAAGSNCEWDNSGNDATIAFPVNGIHAENGDVGQFNRYSLWSGLNIAWAPILRDSYVELPIHVWYSGSTSFGNHPQNIPVVFTRTGMNYKYYYYGGNNASCGADPVVTPIGPFTSAANRFLRIGSQQVIPTHEDLIYGTANEPWVRSHLINT